MTVYSTRVSSSLAFKTMIRIEVTVFDKHSSLLLNVINYGQKSLDLSLLTLITDLSMLKNFLSLLGTFWYNKLGRLIPTSPTCGLYYKTFGIVIYDRNDSTIVEPVL